MKRFVPALFLLLFSVLICQPAFSESNSEDKPILAEVNDVLARTLFFDMSFGAFNVQEIDKNGQIVLDENSNPIIKKVRVPFVVFVLFLGGLFFTFYYFFINIRAFKHAFSVIAGKFDKEGDTGDVSHFKALTSALSATIGLGNIAGVAIAIQIGGPGAAFWMIVTAFFGMSLKFSSCTLAQLYRQVNPDGSISGGPMYYLDLGFKAHRKNFALLGKALAIFYGIVVIFGALGGGNMFQANQTVEALVFSFGLDRSFDWIVGSVLAVLVGVVILGGVKRIAEATSRIVPTMLVIYVSACLFVIISNISSLPAALGTMISMAFSENAMFGGFIGVLVAGIQRASFSNEAGLGSAAIVHAAAKTDEPVREGIVAMLGPFIDTMVICLMTATVVVITGVWSDPALAAQGANIGVSLTASAFATVLPWFPKVLTICICLFAYSTMVSWCYYGERGWLYIFNHFGLGTRTLIIYRLIFIFAVVYGATNSLEDVINFTDYLILALAVPNIIGSLFLAPVVKAKMKDYMSRLSAKEL